MDVKTSFLNDNLVEDVYMTQPEDFEYVDPKKVWELQRSIYGPKHASISWNIHFDQIIKEFDFVKN